MPKISILIPVYNAELYLNDTIESVFKQTYTDWHLVILEDNSTDNSYQEAKKWADRYPEKVSLFRNETNLGMLGNWNKGIGLCKSPFFVKLDADDLWENTFLEECMAVLEKEPSVGLTFSKYVNINEKNEIIANSEIALPDFAKDKAFSCKDLVLQGQNKMLAYPILRQGLGIMRREVFEVVGLYRHLLTPETQASTDTEFYFRLGAHYNIYCIDKTLYRYRIHQNSISKLDALNNLAQKKLYEIKIVIFNFYKEIKVISDDFYLKNKKEIEFVFLDHQQYSERVNRHYFNMACIILKMILKYPTLFLDKVFSFLKK
jgi:glycosyltransferase involved in cell wall biosynthesis